MSSTIALVMTLVAVAIPIVITGTIVRRMVQVSKQLRDPTRLQRAFAESAGAALRRGGADPKAVAKLEVLGIGAPGERGALDLRAAVSEARATLRRPDVPAPIAPPSAAIEPGRVVRHTPRRVPENRAGGFDMGDHFRLSEPPETGEPHGSLRFNANWLALAALIGAAAYYLIG